MTPGIIMRRDAETQNERKKKERFEGKLSTEKKTELRDEGEGDFPIETRIPGKLKSISKK